MDSLLLADDIVWLGDEACRHVARVGGKAAMLSRLAAGYRVPAGFCVTADAYRRSESSERLPSDLYAAIIEAWTTLALQSGETEPRVAVRSSAVDEDGPLASFAGQHETYLNVTGVSAVIDAIERCWASARTEQALAYRRQHGLSVDGISVAVLVQMLAPADVSAVVFSAHPISGRRDEAVVTASWGLGESIVGGTVTPDSWTIRKGTGDIVERRTGDKRRMTVMVPGGTREVDVPRLMRQQPSLSDEQILDMTRLVAELEQQMGWPVDVECAWARGHLYLLQCRPITTLDVAPRPSPVANTPAVQFAS